VSAARGSRRPVGLLFLSLHIPRTLQEDPLAYAAVSGQIVDRLVGAVRATDWKGRVTADTFVLVLPGLGRATDVMVVAEGVMKAMDMPFFLGDTQIYLGCSAGVAVLGSHAASTKGLWRKGVEAVLRARSAGPGTCEEAQGISGGSLAVTIRSAASWRPSHTQRAQDREAWEGPRRTTRSSG
jgi:GGDEF domain-containing protein